MLKIIIGISMTWTMDMLNAVAKNSNGAIKFVIMHCGILNLNYSIVRYVCFDRNRYTDSNNMPNIMGAIRNMVLIKSNVLTAANGVLAS